LKYIRNIFHKVAFQAMSDPFEHEKRILLQYLKEIRNSLRQQRQTRLHAIDALLQQHEEEEELRMKRILCDFIREHRQQRQLLISSVHRYFYATFLRSLSLFRSEPPFMDGGHSQFSLTRATDETNDMCNDSEEHDEQISPTSKKRKTEKADEKSNQKLETATSSEQHDDAEQNQSEKPQQKKRRVDR
jgi:hypothetical protein